MQTTTVLATNTPYIVMGRVIGHGLLWLDNNDEDAASRAGALAWSSLVLGTPVIAADTAIVELLIWGAELTDEELSQVY